MEIVNALPLHTSLLRVFPRPHLLYWLVSESQETFTLRPGSRIKRHGVSSGVECAVESLRLRGGRGAEEYTEQAVHEGARKNPVTLALPPPPRQTPSLTGPAKPGPHLDQDARPESPVSLQRAAGCD